MIRGGVARGIPAAENLNMDGMPDRFRQMYQQRRDRWDEAGLEELLEGMTRMQFMLRFTLSHPDMHTTIVGTANPEHLADNLNAAEKGVLPADLYAAAKQKLASVA